jgi:hypothetical protein
MLRAIPWSARLVFVSALMCCAAGAASAGAPLQIDKFSLEVGTFLLSTDTQVRVDGSNGQPGTDFDVEQSLGHKDVSRFRIDGAWRFGDRHSVTALWFDNARSNTRVIDRNITVGDVTYPLNAEVSSRFSTKIIDLAYEYVFLQRESYELAGSVGLHKISFGLDLSVEGSTSQAALSSDVNTGAPLPLFGLRGSWQLTDQLKLDAHAQYFTLSVNDIDGSVYDLRADLTWMFSQHFGAGLGYNEFRFKADLDRPRFNGRLRWQYGGPLVFVRGVW